MAERRMFTKKVTDDDNFMSLSSSAQALYLHLSMSADDDGFCNQVNLAMFKAHASVQDLEALLSKRYVIQFENGVIVIKHWRMANALRKDRYVPTTFQDEFKQLQLKENGAYTVVNNNLVANWLPDGCQTVAAGEDRLDENSIGENRIGNINILSNTEVFDCSSNNDEPSPKYVLQEYVDMWNTLTAYGVSKCLKLPADSKCVPMLRKRLKEYGKDSFEKLIEEIKTSDFLLGKISSRGKDPFHLTFGWAIKPNNYRKILQGDYRNREKYEAQSAFDNFDIGGD